MTLFDFSIKNVVNLVINRSACQFIAMGVARNYN